MARRVRKIKTDQSVKKGAALVMQADTQELVDDVRTGKTAKIEQTQRASKDHIDIVVDGSGVKTKDLTGATVGLEDVQGRTGAHVWHPERRYYNAWTHHGNVHLLYKDEGGNRRKEIIKFDWYFYMTTRDFRRLPRSLLAEAKQQKWFTRAEVDEVSPEYTLVYCPNDYTASSHVEKEWGDALYLNPGKLPSWKLGRLSPRHKFITRINMFSRREVAAGREPVLPLEADLTPKLRFVTDYDITVLDTYSELYFDLETDDRVSGFGEKEYKRILSVAWTSSLDPYISDVPDSSEHLPLRVDYLRSESNTDEGESGLLLEFAKVIRKHDVHLAWNGWSFDHPIVRARLRYHRRLWDLQEDTRRLKEDPTWQRSRIRKAWTLKVREILPVERKRQERAEFNDGAYVPDIPPLPGNPFDMNWRWHVLADTLPIFKRYHMRGGTHGVSFALDAIGQAVLQMPKLDWRTEFKKRHPGEPAALKVVELYERDPELLKKYNVRDVEILYRLEEFTGYLKLDQTFSRIGNCFVNDYHISTKIDGLLLKKGKRDGYHWPTRYEDERSEMEHGNFEGGFVFEPIRGLHPSDERCAAGDRICAFDFKSLYPSMITTFNIGPDTFVKKKDRERLGGKFLGKFTAPDGTEYDRWENLITCPGSGETFTSGNLGFIPQLFAETLHKRKKYTDLQKTVRLGSDEFLMLYRLAYSFKRLGLSFYGEMGNPSSRYFNTPVARSVTLAGQFFTKSSAKFAEEVCGLRVLYGDTDSMYIQMDPSKAAELVNRCHEWYRTEIFPMFNAGPSNVELEFEDVYERILLVNKKRYAGFMVGWKGQENVAHIEIKGLEFIRSDGLSRQRELQMDVIRWLLGLEGEEGSEDNPLRPVSAVPPDEIRKRLLDVRTSLERREYPAEDLAIAKGVSKDPSRYKGSPALHVRLARKIKEAGGEFYVGMKIPYIVTSGTPSVEGVMLEDYLTGEHGDYDATYYWDRAIYPASQRLLEAAYPDEDWEGLLFSTEIRRRQTTEKYTAWLVCAEAEQGPEEPNIKALRQKVGRRVYLDEQTEKPPPGLENTVLTIPPPTKRKSLDQSGVTVTEEIAPPPLARVYKRTRWRQILAAVLYRPGTHVDADSFLTATSRPVLANLMLRVYRTVQSLDQQTKKPAQLLLSEREILLLQQVRDSDHSGVVPVTSTATLRPRRIKATNGAA